jgi:hypothetical protein
VSHGLSVSEGFKLDIYIIIIINKGLDFTATRLLTFKATVHEDSMGALRLAQLEPGQHTRRSKL